MLFFRFTQNSLYSDPPSTCGFIAILCLLHRFIIVQYVNMSKAKNYMVKFDHSIITEWLLICDNVISYILPVFLTGEEIKPGRHLTMFICICNFLKQNCSHRMIGRTEMFMWINTSEEVFYRTNCWNSVVLLFNQIYSVEIKCQGHHEYKVDQECSN